MKNPFSPFGVSEAKLFPANWLTAPGRSLQASLLAARHLMLASALAFCVAVAGSAHAATASFTNNPPPLGANDISQLTNAADRTNNVGGIVDDQGGNFVYLD